MYLQNFKMVLSKYLISILFTGIYKIRVSFKFINNSWIHARYMSFSSLQMWNSRHVDGSQMSGWRSQDSICWGHPKTSRRVKILWKWRNVQAFTTPTTFLNFITLWISKMVFGKFPGKVDYQRGGFGWHIFAVLHGPPKTPCYEFLLWKKLGNLKSLTFQFRSFLTTIHFTWLLVLLMQRSEHGNTFQWSLCQVFVPSSPRKFIDVQSPFVI